MALASRYVCEIVHGAPPSPTHEAAHNCGKGHLGCVNPHHLEWKTSKDNQADKLLHGTSNRGIRQGSCKITDVQAREILTLKGARTLKYLADKFNISPSTVRSIQERKTWAWLD
jgi:hypothetical protein